MPSRARGTRGSQIEARIGSTSGPSLAHLGSQSTLGSRTGHLKERIIAADTTREAISYSQQADVTPAAAVVNTALALALGLGPGGGVRRPNAPNLTSNRAPNLAPG